MKKDILIFYTFSFLVGFYIANGTTVLFERVLGFSYQQIFNLGAVYMLMFIIFEVPSGAIADLVGRKKSIICGCFILALAALATGMSTTFLQVFLSFFIWALGFSFISGADEALLYDRLKDHSAYTKVIGYSRFFALTGTALAGIFGPHLFSLNFRFPYLFSTLPFFLGGVVMLFFYEPPSQGLFSLARHIQQIRSGVRVAWHNNYILWAIAIMSLTFAVWYNLSNSYQPFIVDVGFSIRAFSLILPALFVLEAVGGSFSSLLYKALGERAIFLVSLVGIAISLGLAGFLSAKISLVFLFSYSFLLGVVRPAISVFSNRYIDSTHRATVISVQAMISTITAALTLFLFGFLTDQIGLNNLFMLLAGTVLVMSAMLLISKPKNQATP